MFLKLSSCILTIVTVLQLTSCSSLKVPHNSGTGCLEDWGGPGEWKDGSSVGLGCLWFDIWNYYTMEEGAAYCAEQGAHLLEVTTEEQYTFMFNAFYQVGFRTWWIGATDSGHEGHWIWQHTLQDVGEFGWGDEQPGGGTDHNCAMAYYSIEYAWMTVPCDSSYKVVCQIN